MNDWKQLPSPTQNLLFDVFGFHNGPLFICGDRGALFRSDDQGGTWQDLSIELNGYLTQFSGTSADDLFVVGSSARSSVLLHARDGKTFKKLSIGKRSRLASVAVWGDDVYVVGDREILKSSDRGESFEVVFSGYLSTNRLLCVAKDHVLAVGYDTILMTTDGGKKWSKQSHHIGAHINSIAGSLQNGLYVAGAWDVIRSTDGVNWSAVLPTNHAIQMNAVELWAPNDLYIAMGYGRVLHKTAQGEAIEQTPAAQDLRQIRAIGGSLYAVGQGGAIVRKQLGERPAGFLLPPSPSTKKASSPKVKAKIVKEDPAAVTKMHEEIEKAQGKSFFFLHTEGLNSLSALAELQDLESLHLWGPTPDLSTLPALPKLKDVTLYGRCKDLAPLASQPALRELAFERTSPSLVGLSVLENVTTLHLEKCTKVTDLSQLAHSTIKSLFLPKELGSLAPLVECALEILSFERTPDGLSSLSMSAHELYLKELKGLALPTVEGLCRLHLEGERLDDLKALASLVDLELLEINSPSLGSLAPLAKLTSLTSLHIRSNARDIAPLRGLTALQSLRLGDVLTELSALREMSMLESLYLHDNKLLSSLRGVDSLLRLKSLYLGDAAVRDVQPLAALLDLEFLDLSKTKIESIEPLRALKKLKMLRLAQTPLRSLQGLQGMEELGSLSLDKTKVKDLAPLEGLSALNDLNIGELGEVENARALSTLSSLTSLYSNNTKFNPSCLKGLPLKYVQGVELPQPEQIGPMGQELGPGMIFSGDVSCVPLSGISLNDVALSPSGHLVAVAMQKAPSNVLVYNTKSAKQIASFGSGSHAAEGVTFSEDGETLYFSLRNNDGYDNDLRIYKVHPGEGEPIELAKLQRRYGGQLLNTRPGLAIVGDRVDLFDLKTNQITKTLMGNIMHGRVRAFMSLDEPRLYIWGLEPSQIARYDLDKGEVTKTWSAPYGEGQFLTVSKGERFIAATSPNAYGVYVIDAKQDKRFYTKDFYAGSHISPAIISADGSLLISFRDVLKGYRTTQEQDPVDGPRTKASYQHMFTAADVAGSGGVIAYLAINYRRESNYLIWFSLCENAA